MDAYGISQGPLRNCENSVLTAESAQHAVHDGPSPCRQQESLRLLRKQTRALPRLCPYAFPFAATTGVFNPD